MAIVNPHTPLLGGSSNCNGIITVHFNEKRYFWNKKLEGWISPLQRQRNLVAEMTSWYEYA